jgi:hypothetical protein
LGCTNATLLFYSYSSSRQRLSRLINSCDNNLCESQPWRIATMPNRLEQLPDELVLGIFSHLRPLRKETYEDFEATSVTEAHQALTSLCLTSKRLSTIATPILYSDAIVSQPDELGPAQISQLLRTIIRDPVRGQQIAYIEHISIQCHQHICAYEYDHKQYYESAIWTEHRKHIQSVARKFGMGKGSNPGGSSYEAIQTKLNLCFCYDCVQISPTSMSV